MLKFLKLSIVCSLIFGSSSLLHAQIENAGTFSGTVFGDYYWMASHHLDGPSPQQDIEGKHGFRFRRIYFTHEYQLGADFSTRLRLEMENPGDYTTQASMTPGVKDAYLKWKPGRHSLYLGISGTPTWDVVERVWGYRSLEQTPLDLQGYGSSRDFGIAAKGPLNEEGTLKYQAMYGNGAGNASEINRGKKFMFSLAYYPDNYWTFQVYGDYNDRPDNSEWYTYQVFASYESDAFSVGSLLAHQVRDNNVGEDDQTIASVFAHFPFDDQMKGVLRLDHTFNNNPNGNSIDNLPFSSSADATFFLAAVDIQPVEDVNVHLMPNIETVFYNNSQLPGNNTPDANLLARMTFSYGF